MAEPSTPDDNPATTQDVTSGGDEPVKADPAATDPASRLAQKYLQKAAPSTGESDSTSGPTAPADSTGQPPGVPTPPDTGTAARMSQELAMQKKAFRNLGIDPDSDLFEKYADGLITVEQLLGRQPTQQATSALERFEQLQEKLKHKAEQTGFDTDDFLSAMDLMKEIAQENRQSQQQRDEFENMQNCDTAVRSVLATDETYSGVPEDIKEIETEFFLSSTDRTLSQDANATGRPAQYFTPRTYGQYAQKNLGRLARWRDFYIEVGKKMATANMAPRKPAVNPISPNIGGAPVMPAEPTLTLDNVRQGAELYKQQQGITP